MIGGMSMSQARKLRVPTPPQGDQIAAYDTYLEAQRAVDHLSDKEFAVQHVTIVGTDLRMVERITGRLTYSRVALAGLASGAWFGLAVGLLLTIFSPTGQVMILPAVSIGAAFGILFAVIAHAFSGGQRDFTSASQIVASSYAILCAAEHAGQARSLLMAAGGPGLGRSLAASRPTEPFGAPPSQAGYGAPLPPSANPPGHQGPGQPGPGQPGPGQPGGPRADQPLPPTQPPAGPQS